KAQALREDSSTLVNIGEHDEDRCIFGDIASQDPLLLMDTQQQTQDGSFEQSQNTQAEVVVEDGHCSAGAHQSEAA
ncbi:unnamed protein product, partial [Amoebophrya sp. A25]